MSLPPPQALIRFFDVAELVSLLCPFLTTKQIFMLGQTNKFLRKVTEPSLWHNVDFETDHRVEMLYTHYDPIYHVGHSDEYNGNILLSKVAFHFNINKTRSLKAGFAFMSYYLEGVRQYLDNDNTQPQQQHQQDIPPSWIPAHQNALFSTPLPLIKQLCRLDVSLLQVRRYPDTFFAGLNNALPLAPQLFRFITLNAAHLTSLSLRHLQLSIADPNNTDLLCGTISSLENLAHLAVDIIPEGFFEPPFSIIPTVFFSCPTSLVSFSMTTTVCGDNAEGLWEEKPFTGLKYLKLPQHRTGYKIAQLNLILDQCPALEEWANVPSTFAPDQFGGRLRYPLTLLDLSTQPSRNCKGETVMDIMNMIPKDNLKSLDFRLFEDTSDQPDMPAPFFLSLSRHSASLVTISLADINWIQSRSVKHILTTCTALTSLVLASSNTMRSCLTVEDAIAKPWTCTRLRELRIIINLNRGCSNEYTMLEILYTQLGNLEDLEILDLMSACRNKMASKPYTETTMTCMLALSNENSNREGFLECFVKLKNLRILLGSFLLSNQEMKAMVGEAEERWILKNWPRLETIEFISERERRHGSGRWPLQIKLLKQERPNLQFCRSQTR